ncbi:putative Pyruvate kinase, barrel domain containing protein [Leishmania naiffi]|uniref:pyruvate kinase n=1 Tax=Leishmania naiffi TaxID=5678 RepID=A0AAW3C9A3_9TRYP
MYGPQSLYLSQPAHSLTLSILEPLANYRAPRIVCTIGPSTQSVGALKGLIRSGMSVARMNFSHGSHEYHQTTINNVRQAAAGLGVNIATALDTKGPEIRTGLFVGGVAVMGKGTTCYVTAGAGFSDKGAKEKFHIDHASLPKVVSPGGYIYIDGGILILRVLSHGDEQTLKRTVTNVRAISGRRGVNLPGCATEGLRGPAVRRGAGRGHDFRVVYPECGAGGRGAEGAWSEGGRHHGHLQDREPPGRAEHRLDHRGERRHHGCARRPRC